MAKVKMRFDSRKVLKVVKSADIKSLGHAAALVRKIDQASIHQSLKPSAPGTPPHTKKGRFKQAILYAVEPGEAEKALVGTSGKIIGKLGKVHEFGGKYRGREYPARPSIGPALKKVRDRLPTMWRASVRG